MTIKHHERVLAIVAWLSGLLGGAAHFAASRYDAVGPWFVFAYTFVTCVCLAFYTACRQG
jgi:hypothetical protein